MRNKGWVIAAAVCLVIGGGIYGWTRGGTSPETAAANAGSGSGGKPVRGGSAGAQGWFGQANVAGRKIAGIVVDGSGAPIAGATVRAASTLTMSKLRPEPSATTDAAGRFDLGTHPAASYAVVAESPKLTTAIAGVDLRDATATPSPDQLRLVLHACDAAIHGTVRDAAGGTIGGAVVSLAARGMTVASGAVADDAGRYELCVPHGDAAVRVRADGYATIADLVSVFGRTRRDFTLAPGASIIGRAVRKDDRSPVAGALVELRLRTPVQRGRELHLSASTDADGKFQIDGVAPGRHAVSALAERLSTQEMVEVIAEVGKPPEDVVCELVGTFAISGSVVERGSKAPLAGRRVFAGSRNRMMMGQLAREALSQADGSFTIEHVFPGEYVATVLNYFDREPAKVTVDNADVTGVVVEVEARATISGRVLHRGKAVDGARVNNGRLNTISDAEGRYTLRDVPAGTFDMYADSVRVGAFTRGVKVTVDAGEKKTGVDLELDLSGSITGTVVDQHGAALAGAFLSFSLIGKNDFGNATTADDGTFTVRALSGGGEYNVDVRQRDGASATYPPVTGRRLPPIGVPDGTSQITGVRLQVKVERLVIAGRVVDADGKPVADVTVQAIPDRNWSRAQSGISDGSGAFSIADVAPGKYLIVARAPRGDARELDVAAGRTDVALRLAGFGAIEGTVESDLAREVLAVPSDGYARPLRAAVTDHAFQLRNVPAGTYRLIASDGMTGQATVTPGATATVAMKKRETGSIAGRLVDEKGAPVAQARCSAVVRSELTGATSQTTTDDTGAFRLERVTVGKNDVICADGRAWARQDVTVAANEVARLDLVAKTERRGRHGNAGFAVERKNGDEVVSRVAPDGPAAKAGIAVGDIIDKLDGEELDPPATSVAAIELRDPGTVVKVTLERAGKELTVNLSVGPLD